MSAADSRTMKELAEEVLRAQDACNLSGLIHSWSRAISRLRELQEGLSTDQLNRHPINQLWVSKVMSLAGDGADLTAWNTVYDLAGKPRGA